MKWKRKPSEFLSEKTFLIIKDDLQIFEVKASSRAKKSAGSTDTWPPKMKRTQPLYEEPERPKTANLEKPSVLNPKLVDKLDMSLLSKELLCDSIARFRQRGTILSGGTALSRCQSIGTREARQQSLTCALAPWSTGSLRQKRRSLEYLAELRLCQNEVASESPRMQKEPRITASRENHVLARKQPLDNRKLDDNNNRDSVHGSDKISPLSMLKKRTSRTKIPSEVQVFVTAATRSAPEPCKTCGRPDQPERFHSHPKGTLMKPRDNILPSTTVPKSVQKPVALNFRSDKNTLKTLDETLKGRSEKTPLQEKQNQESSSNSRPSSVPIKKGPRTITCYICGREFGTASFPIHEPKCIQKWERENNALPPSQRRPMPQRPNTTDIKEWNEVAWVESQAQLLPCSRCGRTFLPERLEVHEKSCKANPKNVDSDKTEKVEVTEKKAPSTARAGPPTVTCQICGRKFGTRSIKIHEPQCIKRWHIETDNASTAPSQRKQEPSFEIKTANPSGEPPQQRMIKCQGCGKNFQSNNISIHESQCLKTSRSVKNSEARESDAQENNSTQDVLPQTADAEELNEVVWKSHLEQLVPCKLCKRTFNPDRVIIHERSCKGVR